MNFHSVMKKTNRLTLVVLLTAVCAAGCSSISLPSLPSFPWSKSAPMADPSAEALYEEGLRNFNEKKYVRAIDNLTKLKTEQPFSPLVTQAELKIADAFYQNQQYPEAISAFKEFHSMHPTNENAPFVLLRLGQAHFDQFTSADRDQKTTEIAKGYFETVITNHPKSSQAAEARDKLAKCLEYLAENQFAAALFYYQDEKYPAARDRFEEIVRKFKDTPSAVKSLFYLGESYRKEKNGVKATLAYEALIQHYPQSKFATEAKTQLAQLEKEKHDPLAMLLMRDRRPGAAVAPEIKEDPALSKLKELNLIAKKEVVYEEPGDDKAFLQRIAEKLNPFSSDSGKKEDKPQNATELLAKRKEAEKKESGGLLASLWPFGRQDAKNDKKAEVGKSSDLVNQVDDSLKQKGIDAAQRQAALKPPAADLPKPEPEAPKSMDSGLLLGSIDANLQKSGKSAGELPPSPAAAEFFTDPATLQASTTKPQAQPQAPASVTNSGLLSSIDQKLKSQGVEPARFEAPPSDAEIKENTAKRAQSKNVELEPKLAVEKGPLFLTPAEVQSQEKTVSSQEAAEQNKKSETLEKSIDAAPKALVKGPITPAQSVAAKPKPAEQKKPPPGDEDENKGVFDALKQDIENASKLLNPFRW
jgi:outer membrane protein assembly factor BamD